MQSGVGNIANSVLAALGSSKEIPPFDMYTEVLQDSAMPLLENGRIKFASTTALTLSHELLDHLYGNLDFFRQRVLMRPQEISNHPEIARRLGIISMNTAIEVDLCGNVNSTHIMGRQLMNGIGGSGDFTRNAYISIFTCPSTQKDSKVSTVVPMVTHTDHSEHSVDVLVTEHGVADLRGKDPRQRAVTVIENCADPAYREQLRDYLKFVKPGHEPLSFKACSQCIKSSSAMETCVGFDGNEQGYERHDRRRDCVAEAPSLLCARKTLCFKNRKLGVRCTPGGRSWKCLTRLQ